MDNIENIINSHSPYLSRLIDKYPDFAVDLFKCQDLDQLYEEILSALNAENYKSEDKIIASLRQYKAKIALLVAVADISGYWDLEGVTNKLSKFADLVVKKATIFILNQLNNDKIIKLSRKDIFANSGLAIFAVGKLGSYELNYSSDIDILVFYDEENIEYNGRHNISRFYIDITRQLVKILSENTKDGYVFRTDLRLRPDPSATPAAVSRKGAEYYYATLGQNWERAAMIKARPICGDENVISDINNIIESFVWRRKIDFDTLQDIHSIKRQIDSNIDSSNWVEYNVKLGHGGIREIEFYAQTQQLIWGGMQPELRIMPSIEVLGILYQLEHVTAQARNDLTNAYIFYRNLEHRLQMVNDAQTHSLPRNESDMKNIAKFMGFDDTNKFLAELSKHVENVAAHYKELFADSKPLSNIKGNLVFTGSDHDPETLKTLKKLGFKNPKQISSYVRGWHYGRYKIFRSKLQRRYLTEIIPNILEALGKTSTPDENAAHLDNFIANLPEDSDFFTLIFNHDSLIDDVITMLGSFPFIATSLSRYPNLIDYIITHDVDNLTLRDRQQFIESRDKALDNNPNEPLLETLKYWQREQQFRINVLFANKDINALQVMRALSDIADCCIEIVLNQISEEYEITSLTVVALGKLGSRQLTISSDVDLILLYDPSIDKNKANILRAGAALVSALSDLTKAGRLYEVDLRLRPLGADSPIVTDINSFKHYYQNDAWGWELMSILRARVIVGSSKLLPSRINGKRIANIAEDLGIIYEKTKKQYVTNQPFALKYAKGGLLELEYVILHHIIRNIKLLDDIPNALDEMIEILIDKEIIDSKYGTTLKEILNLYHKTQLILRLVEYNERSSITLDTIQNTVLEYIEYDSFKSLEKTLVKAQKTVHELFNLIIKTGETND